MEGKASLGSMNIEWLGHASFRFTASGKTVYTDPMKVSGQKADLILVTHDHFDHCDPESVKSISGKETVIIAPEAASVRLKGLGRVMAIRPGESFDAVGVRGKAVHAYNTNKKFHPKGVGVGYVFTIDGKTIYQAGDTDEIPEMKELGHIDVALVPVGGTYTMTADEAANAINTMIKPGLSIPMHWGSIVGNKADAERFRDAVSGEVEILPRI